MTNEHGREKMRKFLLAVFACGVAGCFESEPARSGPAEVRSAEEFERIAMQTIAGRQGIVSENLKVVRSVTGKYLNVGTVREYKILNEIDGTIRGVALDEAGQEVDVVKLQQVELAARQAVERRLDAPLAARLAGAKPDELIEVAIWLREPTYTPPARPMPHSNISHAAADQIFAQVDQQRAAFVKNVVDPLATQLRGQGFEVKTAAYAPVVYAILSPETIEELRASKDVDRMYLPVTVEPTLLSERKSIAADVVNTRGFNGTGVQVAAVEVGGRINPANPFLAGVTVDSIFSCASSHTTAVAGIIRSTQSPETGVAPGSNLWIGGSCSGNSIELQDRSSAASAWGARVLNLSFGAVTGGALIDLDRYYDNLTINQFRTVIPAAANDGNGTFVRSPGTAYNVITVGAYDETTNQMATFSSGVDPGSTHADREKPEVAAPGVNFLSTTDASPWIGDVGSGTSYAAPMVTGTAALMMQRDTALQAWPEGIRAILMTTGTRNLEGATRLSELDGAGGIRAEFADNVSHGVSGTWNGIGYNCSSAPTTVVGSMSLDRDHLVRVAISFDTDPNYVSYGTQPSADLDLMVRDPSGVVVATSASFDNTYEIVEFRTFVTGSYSIEVSKFRCDLSPRFLAYAFMAQRLLLPASDLVPRSLDGDRSNETSQ